MATSRTPEQFARRMRLRADAVGDSANRVLRQAALAIDQALVLGTPVDTGRARSNWLVSLGSPRQEVVPPYAPGKNLGQGEGANARGAINQGKTALASVQSGQTVFISNNLPYIGPLNDGHSAQAPANFVETAVQEGVRAVRNAKLLET